MKAITFSEYGPANVLQLSEIPKPVPNDNEILINIKATSVNAGDWKIRSADPFLVRLGFGLFKPKIFVLGIVIAGVVESVGSSCTKYKVGDRVFGLSDLKMGTYAEYRALSETAALSLIPANITFEQAASVPFGFHTANYFLGKLGIKPGQKIMIYGASGAVGTAAIQLAKHWGAEVTAVCSEQNFELAKSIGADFVYDYNKNDWLELEKEFDFVFETVNKASIKKISKLVKPGGSLILGGALPVEMIYGFFLTKLMGIKLVVGFAEGTIEDMDFAAKLLESGEFKVVIDKTFELDQMQLAHEYSEKGHKKGNVVIRVSEPVPNLHSKSFNHYSSYK
jgi:NADPH:quinone reductase-like Zn-dependent oxidoreductase